jgi:hypothetical protein
VYRTDDWKAAIDSGGCFAGLLQDGSNVSTVFASTTLYANCAPEPFLFLPIAGSRGYSSGLLQEVGVTGAYWSSTVTGKNAYSFSCSTNIAINSNTGSNRAIGLSVRCIAE